MFYYSHDMSNSDYFRGLISHKRQISKVSSREIELHHLYHKSLNNPGRKEKSKLTKTLANMMKIEDIFASFLSIDVENL